jgi:hypothetical protein
MPEIDGVLYCDGCGAEIVGPPVVRDHRRHCCQDCADGLPCDCGLILDDERHEGKDSYAE